MDESLQLVASRRGDGGTLQGVWYFRKTGYEIFDNRYQEFGIPGLVIPEFLLSGVSPKVVAHLLRRPVFAAPLIIQ